MRARTRAYLQLFKGSAHPPCWGSGGQDGWGRAGAPRGGRARTPSPARGGGPVLAVVLSETKGAQGTSPAPGVLSPIIRSALRRLRRTLMMDFIILPERETSLRFPSPCPLPCPPRGDPVPTSSPAPPDGFCSFVGFPQTWRITQTPMLVIWGHCILQASLHPIQVGFLGPN